MINYSKSEKRETSNMYLLPEDSPHRFVRPSKKGSNLRSRHLKKKSLALFIIPTTETEMQL